LQVRPLVDLAHGQACHDCADEMCVVDHHKTSAETFRRDAIGAAITSSASKVALASTPMASSTLQKSGLERV